MIYGSNRYPVGSVRTFAWRGMLLTLPDGSEWMANVQKTIPYEAKYAGAPACMKSPHAVFKGPGVGGAVPMGPSNSTYITYNPVAGIWLIALNLLEGDDTGGWFYYTSTDDGVTWTQRVFPNNKSYRVEYLSGVGKFVGVAPSTTTSGIITSTDGVTWSTVDCPVALAANNYHFASDGVNNIVIVTGGNTMCVYSLDGGATWASSTLPASQADAGYRVGQLEYHAGAGLFVSKSTSRTSYQTSPTGAIWTSQSFAEGFAGAGLYFSNNVLFASDGTTLLALADMGFCLSTLDGLSWTNPRFITPNEPKLNSRHALQAVWHDGARYCAIYGQRVFYSADGLAWTEGGSFGGAGNFNVYRASRDRVLRGFSNHSVGQVSLQVLTDVTAVIPKTIIPLGTIESPSAAGNNYCRIK